MDVFMQEAAQRGILVMFDLHLIDPMKGFDPVRSFLNKRAHLCCLSEYQRLTLSPHLLQLWYTEKVSEPEINGALSRVLGRYEVRRGNMCMHPVYGGFTGDQQRRPHDSD